MIPETTSLTLAGQNDFAGTLQVASLLSKSDIVPKVFQGNEGNCFIAVQLAGRIQADPFMIMQNLDVIHGKPGFSSKFLIGCFNQCGRFEPISYEDGPEDGGRKRAISRHISSGKEIVGPWVSMNMAKAEGWLDKNGSKWKTMPELMLSYRAAAFMIRVTAPEISLGLPATEELHDTEGFQNARNVTPTEKAPDWSKLETKAAPVEQSGASETPLDRVKVLFEESDLTVTEALAALMTLGIGDGKTSFSKLPNETLSHIADDWGSVLRVAAELKGEEGK